MNSVISFIIIFILTIIVITALIVFLVYGFISKENNNSNIYKGHEAEYNIQLNLVNSGELFVLRNLYIPKINGTSTEIDVLCINEYGIFVYESKNFNGWIFGNEYNDKWTQCIKGGNKYHFTNPIKQNYSHIYVLKNFINDNSIPYFSVIVFGDNCTFKKLDITQNNYVIFKYHELNNYIYFYRSHYNKILEKERIEQLYYILINYTTQRFNTNSI